MDDRTLRPEGLSEPLLPSDVLAGSTLAGLVAEWRQREQALAQAPEPLRALLAAPSAAEALPAGIHGQLEARALARRLASGPPVAYRYMKENLNRALLVDLRTCLADEAAGMVRTGLTEDNREAIRAFVEKREPVFQGR